jgi:magnesium-transporting ATPase (P-type)
LGSLYDIQLYSVTYYGILIGAVAAFVALRLAFEQGKYRISSIETAITIAFLGPVFFLLFLVIGNILNLAVPFMFCQAAFVGMAFELFIALLGHGLQVRMSPSSTT